MDETYAKYFEVIDSVDFRFSPEKEWNLNVSDPSYLHPQGNIIGHQRRVLATNGAGHPVALEFKVDVYQEITEFMFHRSPRDQPGRKLLESQPIAWLPAANPQRADEALCTLIEVYGYDAGSNVKPAKSNRKGDHKTLFSNEESAKLAALIEKSAEGPKPERAEQRVKLQAALASAEDPPQAVHTINQAAEVLRSQPSAYLQVAHAADVAFGIKGYRLYLGSDCSLAFVPKVADTPRVRLARQDFREKLHDALNKINAQFESNAAHSAREDLHFKCHREHLRNWIKELGVLHAEHCLPWFIEDWWYCTERLVTGHFTASGVSRGHLEAWIVWWADQFAVLAEGPEGTKTGHFGESPDVRLSDESTGTAVADGQASPGGELPLPRNKLIRALANAVKQTFDVSDWEDFGHELDIVDRINNHTRLLRGLQFDNEDYLKCIYEILKALPDDKLLTAVRYPKIRSKLTDDPANAPLFTEGTSQDGVFFRFEVISKKGSGGFGRVEAVKLRGGQTLARKVFAPRDLDDSERQKALERFRREVETQIKLGDMAIGVSLPVLFSDLESEPPSFYMPLAQCHLQDHMSALRSDLSKRDYLRESSPVLVEVLARVGTLHAKEFVHRDLKPENVLLWSGRWVLCDFGMCLDFSNRFTSVGTNIGTWAYQAPEAKDSARDVTRTADIYSLGCVLHDFFSDGSSERETWGQAGGPGEIGKVISKCTEKDPSLRFQTVHELSEAFATAAERDSAVR